MKRPWELSLDEIVWAGQTLATLRPDHIQALALYLDALAMQAYRNGDQPQGLALEGVMDKIRTLVDEGVPAALKEGGAVEGGRPDFDPPPSSPPVEAEPLPEHVSDDELREVLQRVQPKSPTLTSPRKSRPRGRS